MLDGIRGRVAELAINGERFDEFAGLPRGYLSKLIGANPTRRIAATSMGPLFAALGLRHDREPERHGAVERPARTEPVELHASNLYACNRHQSEMGSNSKTGSPGAASGLE
jgi:hypothetical protein